MIFLSRRNFLKLSVISCVNYGCINRFAHPEDRVDVWFFDVGYGDAILIRHNANNVFIDGGYPVCTEYLKHCLLTCQTDQLDALIITHPHPDHIGGAFGLLDSGIPVKNIYGAFPLEHGMTPLGFRNLIMSHSAPYTTLRRNDSLLIGEQLHFDVLHPDKIVQDMNDSSLVLRLNNFGGGLLLTGDIGVAAQMELFHFFGVNLKSNILKVPHHGGDIHLDFINCVDPDFAVIQSGTNPYGNPKIETLRVFMERDIPVVGFRDSRSYHLILRPDGSFLSGNQVPRGTCSHF